LTVDEAINHPYFANLRKLDNPPKCPAPFDWSWEAKMQKESEKHKNPYHDRLMICKLIYNESLTFHPEVAKAEPIEVTSSDNEIEELPLKPERS